MVIAASQDAILVVLITMSEKLHACSHTAESNLVGAESNLVGVLVQHVPCTPHRHVHDTPHRYVPNTMHRHVPDTPHIAKQAK